MSDGGATPADDGPGDDPLCDSHFAVVGTDTGVGKTIVTAGLVGWLRDAGVDARGIKPCQTGYPPDDDAGVVAEASEDEDAATCLRRLEPALAPAVAADQTGETIRYEEILSGVQDALDSSEVGVVEGIGGLRVPLSNDDEEAEVIDLIEDLDIPAVVVARSGLGTLNHTALTADALQHRGVEVQGIVLNQYEGADLAERTNPDVLESMTDCPVWPFPPVTVDPPSLIPAAVREALPAAVFP